MRSKAKLALKKEKISPESVFQKLAKNQPIEQMTCDWHTRIKFSNEVHSFSKEINLGILCKQLYKACLDKGSQTCSVYFLSRLVNQVLIKTQYNIPFNYDSFKGAYVSIIQQLLPLQNTQLGLRKLQSFIDTTDPIAKPIIKTQTYQNQDNTNLLGFLLLQKQVFSQQNIEKIRLIKNNLFKQLDFSNSYKFQQPHKLPINTIQLAQQWSIQLEREINILKSGVELSIKADC